MFGGLGVEVVDLYDGKVVPLTRNQPTPTRRRATLYGFNRGAFSTAEELEVRLQARELGGILGLNFQTASGVTSHWYYSDSAHEKLGEAIAADFMAWSGVFLSAWGRAKRLGGSRMRRASTERTRTTLEWIAAEME